MRLFSISHVARPFFFYEEKGLVYIIALPTALQIRRASHLERLKTVAYVLVLYI